MEDKVIQWKNDKGDDFRFKNDDLEMLFESIGGYTGGWCEIPAGPHARKEIVRLAQANADLKKIGAIFKRMMDAHIENIEMTYDAKGTEEEPWYSDKYVENENIVVECVKQIRYLKALQERKKNGG